MIKKAIIVLVWCVAGTMYAQNGSISPYSYFGLGEIRAVNSIENQMMGGLSMFGDSIHINLSNPASYGRLKLTAYAAVLSRKEIGFKSANGKENSSVTSLDYLAIGFPIAKGLGVGFGIKPYSAVGYGFENEVTDPANGLITNKYDGEGGLNTVYFSTGAQLFKDFTLGATLNFHFGTIENRRVQNVENVQFGTFDFRESKVNGVNFKLAANYTPNISEKTKLHTYLGIDTQMNLSSENSKEIGSFSSDNGQEIEKITVDLDAMNLKNRGITSPTRTTLGLGLGDEKKWFLGAEYEFQSLGDYTAPFFEVDNLEYTDAVKYTFGGYFTPDYSSFSDYFKRITYRAGANFGKSGMIVNGEDINDFGITFGVSLPMGANSIVIFRNFSNVNLGFEYGNRGTVNSGLIKENYFKLSIGLSLNDRWFQKREIN